jgi:hypothetical protein
MPTVRLQNGNIDADGTLQANNVVTTEVVVSGDLTASGTDTAVVGEPIQNLGNNNILKIMSSVHYRNTTPSITISVIKDTNVNTVKTCYLITEGGITLEGVDWIYPPVGLEDTTKTHVVALQQIADGNPKANLAYSY